MISGILLSGPTPLLLPQGVFRLMGELPLEVPLLHVLDDSLAASAHVGVGLLLKGFELLRSIADPAPLGRLVEHLEHPKRLEVPFLRLSPPGFVVPENAVSPLLAGEGDGGCFARPPRPLPGERRNIFRRSAGLTLPATPTASA